METSQQSGQSVLKDIIRIIAKRDGRKVYPRWVPAHERIVGNERAHQEAHRATKPKTAARLLQRTGSVQLKSAAIRCCRDSLMRERTEQVRLEGRTGWLLSCPVINPILLLTRNVAVLLKFAMAVVLPSRLLSTLIASSEFSILAANALPIVRVFGIISHTWGDRKKNYECGIPGVDWELTIDPMKIEEIKKLMTQEDVLPFMLVDCLCLNQADADGKSAEIAMVYGYYRSARKRHTLVDMKEVWDPQEVVDNLKFVDHIRTNIKSTSISSEAKLTVNMNKRLSMWANKAAWAFPWTRQLLGPPLLTWVC
ncbi:hypothetical protein B0O99DRAFT_599482 [Bisporella sp. PMI_857]|nr:hypothetical protein B0O99DRAFT_599482 [Bisporella sp. PMI_857]